MNVGQLLSENLVPILIGAAVIGLIVLIAGIVSWRRRAAIPADQPRPSRSLLPFLGIALLVAVGFFSYRYWPAILRFFRGDYTAPKEELDALKTADLDFQQQPPAPEDEWPQWRGYYRDGVNRTTGMIVPWPEGGPKEEWRKDIGGGYAGIAVSRDPARTKDAQGRTLLYTLDHKDGRERVLCYNADTGDLVWEHGYPVSYKEFTRGYANGPRTTPSVHDGRVYTVGAVGDFLCLDAAPADGKPVVRWHKKLLSASDRGTSGDADLPTWGVAGSPLVEGDLVIVMPGGPDAAVMAFHRISGSVVWRQLSDAAGYSSPIAMKTGKVRQVLCFMAGRLVGLRSSDGAELWEFTWPTKFDGNIATPIVAGEYVFISSDYGSGCAMIRLTPDGDGVKMTPIFERGNKLMRNHYSTCVRRGDYLYGFDIGGDGTGVVSLKCIYFRLLDDQCEKWAATRENDSRLARGSVVLAGDHLITFNENGWLLLVEASPDGFKLKGQKRVFQAGDCRSLPTVAGGRLYVRDDKHIVCLNLRK